MTTWINLQLAVIFVFLHFITGSLPSIVCSNSTDIASGSISGCVFPYLGHVCIYLCIGGGYAPPTQEHDLPLWRSWCQLFSYYMTCHYTLVGGAPAFTTDEMTWFLLTGSLLHTLHWRHSSSAAGQEITTSCSHSWACTTAPVCTLT